MLSITSRIIQTSVNVSRPSLRLPQITLTSVWIIRAIMRKPNPITVLLYIQNSHKCTKMQAKCGSKKLMQLILGNFVIFVISTRFDVTSSASNNIFLTPLSNNSALFDGNDATAAEH